MFDFFSLKEINSKFCFTFSKSLSVNTKISPKNLKKRPNQDYALYIPPAILNNIIRVCIQLHNLTRSELKKRDDCHQSSLSSLVVGPRVCIQLHNPYLLSLNVKYIGLMPMFIYYYEFVILSSFFTKQFINLLDFLFTKYLKLYTIKQIIYSSPKSYHMLVLTYY